MTDLPANTRGGGDGLLPTTVAVESPAREHAQVKAQARREGGDEAAPFTGAALWGVGLLLALANFMAVLDTTITNVSVPNIAGGLAVSPSEGTWTITSYAVAEAITVPLTGWLATRFGTVTTFTWAMILFGVFSFLCGFADSLGMLVFFRICQGLAGGPMIPLSQTLLLRVFPKHLAGQALALWSMTTVVAPIAGPVLGGWICDNVGWPWIFYINCPFAVVVALVSYRLLKPKETPGVGVKIDGVGLGLMVTWIAALQLMLDKGKELDWFASPTIIALAAVAAVGFAAFMIWELTLTGVNPIVNLRVFRHRSFATACGVMTLAFGGFFAANVLVPLWLQTNLGYTASWAGKATAFGGVLAIVFSPVVGRMVGKTDPRILVTIGIVWMSACMAWRATFSTDTSFAAIAIPQFLQGAGIPFFFIPLMSLGTGSLPPDEVASGAGLISFIRTMAGAVGVSIVTTTWDEAGERARVGILNQGGGFDAAIAQMQAAGMTFQQAVAQFEGLVQRQAVMVGTDRLFLAIAAVLFVAGMSIWVAPKPKGQLRAAGGGH